MAYNGSGTFNRVHNFATDKTNQVPVTASRMDAEMDGIATGLSTAIAKDGQTATSARIPFAAGTSAFAGAVSGVAYAQTNDPNTGVYFPAADQYGLAAGGVATLTSTATTVTVPVNLAVTGTGVFPSGTVMLFHQTSAPTGWTKVVSLNDRALRVVSGSVTVAGSTAFSTVFAARTITQANLPNVNFTVTGTTSDPSATHAHQYNQWTDAGSAVCTVGVGATVQLSSDNFVNDSTAESAPHTHTVAGNAASGGSGTAMDFAVAYADVIFATKD
jgi:hypothetical protein